MEVVEIIPMTEDYIDQFRDCLDTVAREREYLALLEAPPPDEVRRFILSAIANGIPQFVALDADRVVGWCDIWL